MENNNPIHKISLDDFLRQTHPGKIINLHNRGPIVRRLNKKGCRTERVWDREAKKRVTFIYLADDLLEELTRPQSEKEPEVKPKRKRIFKKKEITLEKVAGLVSQLYEAIERLAEDRDTWKEAYHSIKKITIPPPPDSVKRILNSMAVHSSPNER